MTEHAFLLRLRDKPGALERIAATFAHRGVSIRMTLANDGDDDPDGLATALVTFRATPGRKTALLAALGRHSWVVSVRERPASSPALRQAAIVRLADGDLRADDLHTETLSVDEARGERTVALFGAPATVEATLSALRDQGRLRAITHATLGL